MHWRRSTRSRIRLFLAMTVVLGTFSGCTSSSAPPPSASTVAADHGACDAASATPQALPGDENVGLCVPSANVDATKNCLAHANISGTSVRGDTFTVPGPINRPVSFSAIGMTELSGQTAAGLVARPAFSWQTDQPHRQPVELCEVIETWQTGAPIGLNPGLQDGVERTTWAAWGPNGQYVLRHPSDWISATIIGYDPAFPAGPALAATLANDGSFSG